MKIQAPVQQTLVRPSESGPAQPAPPAPRPTAIVVAHGMGQQIPYETIDQVTRGLQAAEARSRQIDSSTLPEPDVRVVKMGDKYVRRVELTVMAREVHIYEAYWAPKPHGHVTLRDVLDFLIRAGLNGLTNLRKQVHRMLFRQFRKIPARFGDLLMLVIAILFVVALVALNTIVVAVGAAQMTAPPAWLSPALFADVSLAATLFNAVAITMGAGLYVALMRRDVAQRRLPGLYAFLLDVLLLSAILFTITVAARMALLVRAHRITVGTAIYDADLLRDARVLSTTLVLATAVLGGLAWAARALRLGIFSKVVIEVVFFALIVAGLWAAAAGWLVLPGTRGLLLDGSRLPPWLASAVWVWPFLIVVAAVVRRFLVEFVGDVAVYVSPHTLDRFEDLRNRIKDCVQGVVDAVYHAKTGNDNTYERVIVIGHSLGSVIAYDALNRAILEDQLSNNAAQVAARTAALITFGSPLDKIAFLFAVQGSRTSKTREALVAAGLPLIQDYELRPPTWVNIYSRHDVISGALDLYDDLGTAGGGKRVENVVDPDASIPLLAHTEYWRNVMLFDRLYGAI